MRLRSILAGSLLLLVTPLSAQLSLEEYRSAVVQHSYTLQEAEATTEEAKALERVAWSGRLPHLSASGDFSLRLRHNEGVKPWGFALQPQLVATLYGGGLQAAYRQTTLEAEAAAADEEFTRLDILYAADYAYWNLSAMLRYHEATARYVTIIRSLKEVIVSRFEEGYIAKNDVLMIESRLSAAEFDLLTIEQNLEVALHNFNILRGVESDKAVELRESILDSGAMPRRQSYEEILTRRPDVAAARSRSKAAREGIRRTRAGYLPRIEAGISGVWQPESPNTRGETRLDGSLFGRLSVPIFGWDERRQAIRASEAAARRAELYEEEVSENILREERNGWSALVESYAQIAAADEGLQFAQKSLDLSTYSYNEGLLTILDVLQAQLDWIQLYTNAITAHFNFALARSSYRRTTGGE